jgi:hypothetical protein
MPTLAQLRKQSGMESAAISRGSNSDILISDSRNRMRSTEIIERKLQAALLSRGNAARSGIGRSP